MEKEKTKSHWYTADQTGVNGPYTSTELKRLSADGKLHTHMRITKEGRKGWSDIEEVKGLSLRKPEKGMRRLTFREWYGETWLGKKSSTSQCVLIFISGGILLSTYITRYLTSGFWQHVSTDDNPEAAAAFDRLRQLYASGNPSVGGEVIELRGVNGLTKGQCLIESHSQVVRLVLPGSRNVDIPYERIKRFQFEGKGKIVESEQGGFMGFGWSGIAQALVLNTLVEAASRRERNECEVTLVWDDGSVTLLNSEYLPEEVSSAFQFTMKRIPSALAVSA
jgi:hypothetical protein